MLKRSSRAMTPHSNPEWGVMTPTAFSKVGKYVNGWICSCKKKQYNAKKATVSNKEDVE